MFNLLHLILFVLGYKFGDIYLATKFILISTTAEVIYLKFIKNKLGVLVFYSWLVVVVFGSFTLFLKDPYFIMIKPSILYMAFALTLIISELMNKSLLMKILKTTKDSMDKEYEEEAKSNEEEAKSNEEDAKSNEEDAKSNEEDAKMAELVLNPMRVKLASYSIALSNIAFAAANYYFAIYTSEAAWVDFKIFTSIVLPISMISSFLYIFYPAIAKAFKDSN